MHEDDFQGNEKLFGAIARSAEMARIVGGQEAPSNSLGHPITFKSHKIIYADASFLLAVSGAVKKDEMNGCKAGSNSIALEESILKDLDVDRHIDAQQIDICL